MVSLLVSNVARSGSCTLPPRQDLSARAPCKRPTCGASQTLPLPGHRQPHTDSHSYEFKFCLSTSPHSFSYETCRATTSTRLEKPLSSVLRPTVLRPPDPSYPVTRLYSWFLITALPRTKSPRPSAFIRLPGRATSRRALGPLRPLSHRFGCLLPFTRSKSTCASAPGPYNPVRSTASLLGHPITTRDCGGSAPKSSFWELFRSRGYSLCHATRLPGKGNSNLPALQSPALVCACLSLSP